MLCLGATSSREVRKRRPVFFLLLSILVGAKGLVLGDLVGGPTVGAYLLNALETSSQFTTCAERAAAARGHEQTPRAVR